MVKRAGVLAALVLATGGMAYGACWPFGSNDGNPSDDAGCGTADAVASKAEQKLGGAVSKLVGGIIKCHSKQHAAAYKTANGKPTVFDEETCEGAAETKFLTSMVKILPPSCVNPPGIASLARAVLDGNNYMTYCDGCVDGSCSSCSGAAIDPLGDDAGCVASTAGIQKCEDKLGGCISGLVKDWNKNHAKWAKAYTKAVSKGDPITYDEEAGEQGPSVPVPGKSAVERFNACLTKKVIGCAPCTAANIPAILGLTAAQLDGANGLVYCESPSGAFID